MPRYKNTSGATLTFQGITFKPGEIHDVPEPIHSSVMYVTNLPCTIHTKTQKKPSIATKSSTIVAHQDSNILEDTQTTVLDIDNIHNDTNDIQVSAVDDKKLTKKTKKSVTKEDEDGTNNNK